MSYAVIVPLWVKEKREVLDSLCRLAASLDKRDGVLYVVCNRLHLVGPEELKDLVQGHCKLPVKVLYEPGVERSVAGAWNHGIRQADADGHSWFLLAGVDTEAHPWAIDRMEWSLTYKDDCYDLASGIDDRHGPSPRQSVACDFAFFGLTMATIRKAGWFDALFRPAYFEDNDYFARAILAGLRVTNLPDVRFKHAGSMTINLEPEAAHHVNHWFEHNKARYMKKWGVSRVLNDPQEILSLCHKNPWNDPSLPLTFWERD